MEFDIDESLLNNYDVRTLYYLSKFVHEGAFSSHYNYFYHVPPNVTSVRWITTCTNILMLYCQEPHPSWKLVLLTQIIQKIYVPSIFNIKKEWHVSKGPKHYFNLLLFSRQLLKDSHPSYYENVKKTLLTYSNVIHPENMLLCWLFEPNLKDRAVNIIKTKRANPYKNLRKFQKPTDFINFDAEEIGELLNPKIFTKFRYTSPPLLSDFTMAQIERLDFNDDFRKLCCHNQHVEYYVWLTSEAGKIPRNFTYELCHRWILNHMEETKKLPSDCSREEYLSLAAKS